MMKKTLLFSLLLTLLGTTLSWAQFNPESGKMYALKYTGSELYLDIQTMGVNEPGQTSTNNISLNSKPCIIFFEAGTSDGKWKIKNANGQYVHQDQGTRTWNVVIGSTAYEWTIAGTESFTIARADGNFISSDDTSNGQPLYCDKATGLTFTLVEYPKSTNVKYALKSPTGTYFNFTASGNTAASFQATPSYLNMIPSANGYVFEDWDNAGQFIGQSPSNNWDVGTGIYVWSVSEEDSDRKVSISRLNDAEKFLGHDKNTNSGTGIYTNVGTSCNKWIIEDVDIYENSKPTFNGKDLGVISSNGQYLTALKLGETTIFSDMSAPSSVDDMHVIAEDKNVTLKKGSTYTFTLTFPQSQTSQILVANLWIDKDGDGTYETHLGTTGNAKTSNDLTTVNFTIPADASLCSTRIRFRLDSSWSIAETANADANRMVYDIPVTISAPSVYTFRFENTTGKEVEVTYDGTEIVDGAEIDNIDTSKFDATDIPGYKWTVELDSENATATLVYTKTHYTFLGVQQQPEGNDVNVTYNEAAIAADALIEIGSLDIDLFSANDISGYTWSVVVDEDAKTIAVVYTEAAVVKNPEAVVALVNRIGGAGTADKFKFVLDPSINSKNEVFVLGAEDGKVLVKGTTISAITTGLGWYLNNHANINIAWNSLNEKTVDGSAYADLSNLPLPTATETRTSDAKYRYYLNYCTFGYSMTSWTWKRWQQEIDWMALHGINMPLQIVGLEEVWRKFLTIEEGGKRKYGYTDEAAKAFVAGPAYTAWWGMNNLEGWGGTGKGTKSNGTWAGAGGVQDDAWYARQTTLAKDILARQRELGMHPVLPGFSGMVPSNFQSKSGFTTRGNGGNWAGDFVRPLILSVSNDNYADIAADYYDCLHEVMGESQYYSMDPFHEGGGTGTTEDYKALYDAMEAAKAGSQWVIQQWQWNASQKLSLNAVPAGRLIVLDLFSDGKPAFDDYSGYAPQDAVFCAIPNFGGRSGLMGRLNNLTDNYFAFKAKYATIKGIGAAPEAIEQTPVAYDLLFQLPWMGSKPDVQAWVKKYATARYGADNAVIQEAWELLRQSVLNYGADAIQGPVEDVWAARPNLDAKAASFWGKTLNNAGGTYTPARRQMLIDATYKLLAQNDVLNLAKGSVYESNYHYDLVEFGGGVMADYAYDLLLGVKAAKEAAGANFENDATYKARRDAFLALIADMDTFKGTNLNFRLGKWTQEARDAAAEVEGATTATPDWYEFNNARTLITTWSSPNTKLNDYSYRSWQGLLKDFYLPRWQHFFDNGCTTAEYGYFEWNWAHGMEHSVGQTAVSTTELTEGQPGYSYSREPEGNTVEEAQKLLGKYIIPVAMSDGTHYAYRYLENDLSSKITIVANAGSTIDLKQYFGNLNDVTVTGDFIDGTVTDLSKVAIKADAADGAHTGTISMTDGTSLTFSVVFNPAYYGTYNINYNGKPVFVAYNTDPETDSSDGYKLIDPNGDYSATAVADQIVTIEPNGTGYSLSIQGKFLKSPEYSTWNHILFSDNRAEAGVYAFDKVSDGVFKIYSPSTVSNPVNYVNDYGNVFGNDRAAKANLSTFTLTEVESYPFSVTSAGMATLCLPFNVVMPEGMYAYDFAATNIKNGDDAGEYVCTLKAIAKPGETLKKGTPVIVSAEGGPYNLAITMSDSGAKSSLDGSLLRGNFVKQDLTQGTDTKKFIFTNGDNGVGFYRMRESGTIGANKCWMEWTVPAGQAEARSIVLRFDSETGIDDVVSTPQVQNAHLIYNIAGQRLNAPQKGLNIIGGKRVIVY